MSTRKKDGPEDFRFKSIMDSIEKLVKQLEVEDIPLEKSLEFYEQGIQLIRRAQAQLAQAEQRVQVLVDRDGEPHAVSGVLDDAGSEESL